MSSTITNGLFTADIMQPLLGVACQDTDIRIPLSFYNVKNIQTASGTYTPNNDYLYLFQGLASVFAPTFAIIMVSAPTTLACQFTKSALSYTPTQFAFIEWANDPLNTFSDCYIDGRLSPYPNNSPMAQGVQVSYSMIIGQAQIN